MIVQLILCIWWTLVTLLLFIFAVCFIIANGVGPPFPESLEYDADGEP